MNRNARNRFVAWLGIAAMWLAIVAPVISQTLAARQAANPQAVLCTVDATATDSHAGHHDAGSHVDACSYCGLLAQNLPIVTGVVHDVALIERVTRVPAFANVEDVTSKSFNAASPRAPPVLS
ncbi:MULTISPECIES: DUF2946 domain-containing protein [unclassified Caballeronia]|uniref:DUF2946 domain-containing protein n=1 Tax=unclassified Caballeronia TaxID=2646786 RepID=UPI002028A9B2|nr:MULTISPECIES: DUF2946 domain-containing protein [unclassified Caballeronia]MDR5787387.1 DUF2946 domain-containing protein [Caballeronia sp. LP003]